MLNSLNLIILISYGIFRESQGARHLKFLLLLLLKIYFQFGIRIVFWTALIDPWLPFTEIQSRLCRIIIVGYIFVILVVIIYFVLRSVGFAILNVVLNSLIFFLLRFLVWVIIFRIFHCIWPIILVVRKFRSWFHLYYWLKLF